MRTLYHFPLCPFSRKVRFILAEKKLDFEMELERFWERRPEFMQLNPAGQVPVLIDLNGTTVPDSTIIGEYLEESYPDIPLMGTDPVQRAEVRRLCAWFDQKFAQEVSYNLIIEKTLKRYFPGSNGPNSAAIRTGKSLVNTHLDYISWLVDRRKWLAGDEFSLADITAAAHLSAIDYLGDVQWDRHELAKDWYARLKSRPSFRGLLADRIPGIQPAPHYTDLDF